MKKIVSIALILLLTAELTGCEAIQRKFTRKKKNTVVKPRFYREGMSETRSNLELYMVHYMYWKTWHEELIAKAGENAKRDIMSCNEVITNLMDMRKRLVKEKAKELDSYIDQVRTITDRIKQGNVTDMRMGRVKQDLDKIRARIIRNFYYKKITDYIRLD